MSSAAELQALFYSTLVGDFQIMALAAGVYDRVPADPFGEKTAYITLGETDTVENAADCIDSIEINTTIHIWSRAVGAVECKRLTDLVRRKLHSASLSLSNNALALLYVERAGTMTDAGTAASPDNLTTHGIVQVRAIVEEPS